MTYGYDADGSRIHEESSRDPHLLREYYYDGLGRMSGSLAWTQIGGPFVVTDQPVACVYDPDGQMSKPCDDGAPRLAYDGANVAAAGRAANSSTWRFVHGPGLDDPLIGLYHDSGGAQKVFYWVTDGQGRHFAVADSLGTLSATEYDIWYGHNGGSYSGGTSSANSFTQDRFGTPTIPGISFFRNRAYDQATGRWTQEDPIGVAGGLNLYQFNQNNPVMYTDPFGLRTCPPDCGAIHTVGAVAFGTLGAVSGAVLGTAGGPGGVVVGAVAGASGGAVAGVAAANVAEAAADATSAAMASVGDWIKRVLVAGGIATGGGLPERAKGQEKDPAVEQPVPPQPPPEKRPDEEEQSQ